MDPLAKRFMWEVISHLSTRQGKTAVILTTHSMNEAQALCTRIGIMVHISLVPASLKNLCSAPYLFLPLCFWFEGCRPTKMYWESPASENSIWKSPWARGMDDDSWSIWSILKESNSLFPVLRLNLLRSVLVTWRTFADLFKKGFSIFLLTQEVYLMTLKFALGVLILLNQKVHQPQRLACQRKW